MHLNMVPKFICLMVRILFIAKYSIFIFMMINNLSNLISNENVMIRKVIQLNYRLLFMVLLITSLYSCEYEEMVPPSTLPENVSFSSDLIPIFNQSCNSTGCHSVDGISPDLSEGNAYTDIIDGNLIDLNNAENSILYMRMTDVQSPMPVSGILSETQTNKVLVWIREGAQNN